MGAGRKTETIQVSETPQWSSMTGNSSVSARNLRKSDLGGVIFGCKHNTITECLSKKLFGLPSSHFSYVRNIGPGLPLFLFNYSDRKMHGLYEAASRGEMNIDSYAWTDGGTERTSFPAQVHILEKVPCQPIPEKEFKKVIEDNYYYSQHFWFELDHAQTRALTSLFKPSSSPYTLLAPSVPKKSSFSTGFPTTKWKVAGNSDCVNVEFGEPKKVYKSSVNLVNGNKFASLSWGDGESDHASLSRSSSNGPEEPESKDIVSDWEDLVDSGPVTQTGATSHLNEEQHTLNDTDEEKQTLVQHQSAEEGSETDIRIVMLKLKKLQDKHKGSVSTSNSSSDGTSVPCSPRDEHEDKVQPSEEAHVSNGEETLSTPSPINDELAQVIRELKSQNANLEKHQIESHREMQLLKDIVKESGKKIEQLENHVEELESKLDRSMKLDDSVTRCVEQYVCSDATVYVIGGFNGSSWLSALDSFTPSLDILTPLRPMCSARSYASATALDGNIYVFGGGDGCLWYNTVECYHRSRDEWTPCPNLIHEKGSLAGATLNGKIFAIGGGNGLECFSDVEMFDPALGTWIFSQSMIQKRFAPAAVELNGVLYAVGGYDGKDYLKSAERYDPREAYWTRLPNMNTRRGCHSLAVFNEKLYSIGGYDGENIVSSVETFDPRLGSWVMDGPMNLVRAYAGAVVVGDTLFVIGGIENGENIHDTVEYYKEGTGWVLSNLKAIGTRCFFSAIVL